MRILKRSTAALFSIALLAAAARTAGAENPSLPSRAVIEDIAWIPQTWNNCGPATLAMALDRWGVEATQREIADLIRPNPNDGHVSMDQIVSAAASRGMESLAIPSGGLFAAKTFVAKGFPLMTPTWHIDETGSQMGHYRLIHGYDDDLGVLYLRDSLEPEGYAMKYGEFDALWRVFNRRMLIVYPPERTEEAVSIAAPLGTETEILEASISAAASEFEPPESLPDGMSEAQYRAYADFNRAMALTELGRHSEASRALLSAFETDLPWRMLWYQPEVLESVFLAGEYAWIVDETGKALDPYPYLEELWYWRGRAEKELGRAAEAEEAFRRALEIRPGWPAAARELEGR